MKRVMILIVAILLGTALFGAVACFAQVDTIHYLDNATLAWDAVTVDNNGDPLLPDDVVNYEVYVYDYNDAAVVNPQDTTQLTFVGTTAATEQAIDFSGLGRHEYAAGVRVVVTDGQGAVTYSAIAWSYDSVATDPTLPFLYVPLSGVLVLPAPTGLREAGM